MTAHSLTLSAWAARRLPDENIFDRTLRGDPVAFSEVYRRYQKRIYGYCLARSLDPHTAADATQEVFMKLLRAEPGSIDSPQAWLFTVARNVVIDVIRKRTRTPEDAGIEEGSLAWDRLQSADTAEEVLSRADARNVFLALRTMRPRYRTALVMREIHGETAKDMAEALQTSPGAVDTLVSRARDAFGVAYASVGDLPSACRANVELIYRRHGTGITDPEQTTLQAHLSDCERCRAEAKRADNPRHLEALLPFLVPAKRFAYGLLDRAALSARMFPDVVAQQSASILTQPHTWNFATKIAAGIAAVAIVAAPVAVTARMPSAPATTKSLSTTRSLPSSSRWIDGPSSLWSMSGSDERTEASSWSDSWSRMSSADSTSMGTWTSSSWTGDTSVGSDWSPPKSTTPRRSTSTYESSQAASSIASESNSTGSGTRPSRDSGSPTGGGSWSSAADSWSSGDGGSSTGSGMDGW